MTDQEIVELEADLQTGSDENARASWELLRLGCLPPQVDRSELEELRARRAAEIEMLPVAVILLPLRDPYCDVCRWIIEPACLWENFRPLRIDQEASGMRTMLEKARALMRSASVFVADVSEENPNVYYEIGFLEALGKPGAFVALNDDPKPHYLKDREVHCMRTGLETIARSRARLRAELRSLRAL